MVSENFNERSCAQLFNAFGNCLELLKQESVRTKWTSIIKDFFSKLGASCGYDVAPDIPNGRQEYLIDLCWCFSDNSERRYGIELALESELSGEIFYDFDKLTDVKAHTKVFITIPKPNERCDILKRITRDIAFHEMNSPEEKFLIIFLLNEGIRILGMEGYEVNHLGLVETLAEV